MKIKLNNKPKMIEVKNVPVGECFKYWPNPISCPPQCHVCMRTDGKFCITDCMEAWPIRFVDLMNGEEIGTSENTMVEPLDLQVRES